VFQEDRATGDRRLSGSAASLAGVEAALLSGDPDHLDLALRRLLLAHLVVLGFGGLPLPCMGDELGLLNDPSWVDDPRHAADNPWVHRPYLPPGSVARSRAGHRGAPGVNRAAARDRRPPKAAGAARIRPHRAARPGQPVRAGLPPRRVAADDGGADNFSPEPQLWPRDAVPLPDPLPDPLHDAPSATTPSLVLPPYGALWLVG
jgi:amylosucrase